MRILYKNVDKKNQAEINKTVTKFFRGYKIHPQSNINVEFVSSSKIKLLNNKYRKINKPTDVLSFPIWKNIQDIPEGTVNLGDIIICPDQTDIDNRLEFLVLHSLNHLIGIHH